MRQTQHETNNSQNRKIEQLIERKKSGEDKKKSVENYLIFGILAFCLTLLVVVITSNGSDNSSAEKNGKGDTKHIETQTNSSKPARPKTVGVK